MHRIVVLRIFINEGLYRTNFTAQIGVNHIGEIAARNNWMFRPQPIDDIGIDAHMELTEPTGESKQLLALQIKSGTSWF